MTREYTDAERLDWIQSECMEIGRDGKSSGVCNYGERWFYADDFRSAIDRALTYEQDPERFRDTPDDDGGSYL